MRLEPRTRNSRSAPQVPLGKILVLAVAVAWCAVMIIPAVAGAARLVLAALVLVARVTRTWPAVHLALFALLWMTVPTLLPPLPRWPYSLLIPLLAYGAVVAAVPAFRQSVGWVRLGHLRPAVLLAVGGIIVLSLAGLVLWVVLLRPDLTGYRQLVPRGSAWQLVLAAVGFAMLNAAMEEVAFRGILLDGLDQAFGGGILPVVVQGIVFGVLHFLHGFPNGMVGVVLASGYGVLLGGLRRHSGGLLAPWLAHVGADLTIFGILAGALGR